MLYNSKGMHLTVCERRILCIRHNISINSKSLSSGSQHKSQTTAYELGILMKYYIDAIEEAEHYQAQKGS